MIDQAALERAYDTVREALVAERCAAGHWVGELASSALSTATAVSALSLAAGRTDVSRGSSDGPAAPRPTQYCGLIAAALGWLSEHQNADGGWGDTTSSHSNISTTMLVRAAFGLAGAANQYTAVLQRASQYIDRLGGTVALAARYGEDRTFGTPILTNCALAGEVPWAEIAPLPFELACVPHSWYRLLRLHVVSYALPALIGIGQLLHARQPSRNLLVRWIRNLSRERAMRKLQEIQPASGGFLEAVPLTSFVTMSLLALGQSEHPVAKKGLGFIVDSVRCDGSCAIDSNLSVWLTTLSVGALSAGSAAVALESSSATRSWLLERQYTTIHPYTNSAPGGWGWTHLSGGVPDVDDTAGALLALSRLGQTTASRRGAIAGVRWLLMQQNRDGGWPTFCRGWGMLPFDRSGPDLTAHVLRALNAWRPMLHEPGADGAKAARALAGRLDRATTRGLHYLVQTQRPDGAWVPLWFGNQDAPDEENPTYGTARVLAAYRDLGRQHCPEALRGVEWLGRAQRADGSWGGAPGATASLEETALALEVLAGPWPGSQNTEPLHRGLGWILDQVRSENWRTPSPIGFYFAKLWYSEKLYPLIFTVAALNRARAMIAS